MLATERILRSRCKLTKPEILGTFSRLHGLELRRFISEVIARIFQVKKPPLSDGGSSARPSHSPSTTFISRTVSSSTFKGHAEPALERFTLVRDEQRPLRVRRIRPDDPPSRAVSDCGSEASLLYLER